MRDRAPTQCAATRRYLALLLVGLLVPASATAGDWLDTPLGRIGTPEDIAVVAAFLATAEPMFMTGEVIDVDGGANIN